MNKLNYDKMTRTQIKSKKTDSIPVDRILEYNEKALRPIANRQIESLKKRRAWTGKIPVYNYEINKVILRERGEIQ